MSLEVTRKGIVAILDELRKGEWQIPQFQRDFIWTQEQVKKLIYSFIQSYPLGLLTIWDQPQNQPYTPGEPLALKDGSQFKEFKTNPSVIKLVLDGKQRLTTLAMVFGGFHSFNARFSYSGSWFVDIDALVNQDESKIIIYRKQNEIIRTKLNVLTSCVQQAIIPFKDFHRLGEYLQHINDQDIYPAGQYPEKDIRDNRSKEINKLIHNFNSFQIPIAEIPSSVDLGDVCEIFDVLNTTGTKVSTFDLIHNNLFKDSDGSFLLRDKFNNYRDLQSLGLFCDENRQELLCQIITGCYLLESNPHKNSNPSEYVSSIKGRDLIETPLSFYQKFDQNVLKIDSYISDLLLNILNSDFKITEIPYPVSVIIYISLRWHLEFTLRSDYYHVEELNKIYKSFFWRNCLASRYDQGFLSQFSKDLKTINQILLDGIPIRGISWNSFVNTELNKFLGSQYLPKSKDELIEIVKDSEIRGALRQALSLLVNANAKFDLVTGDKLNRFSEDRVKKVQLHHIFPKNWCTNNSGSYQILSELSENNFANLVPLTSESNNLWRANSPATAIKNFKLDFAGNRQRYEGAFINIDAFRYLQNDDVEHFWIYRTDKISEELYNLQFVN